LLESDGNWVADVRGKLQRADEALTQAASAL
jgi:hypothetical protein